MHLKKKKIHGWEDQVYVLPVSGVNVVPFINHLICAMPFMLFMCNYFRNRGIHFNRNLSIENCLLLLGKKMARPYRNLQRT